MAEPSSRRIPLATVALAAAGLLFVGAVIVAAVRRDGGEAPAADAAAAAATAPAPAMDALIAGLQQRLREDPDDHQGWYLLGRAYRDLGRFAEAERAFRRAMELAPREANYAAHTAEMLLVTARDRAPPEEARQLLRRVLELEPGNPQARYYLATLKDQAGDHEGALADLAALLRDAPPGVPWEAQVREAALAIGQEHGIDMAGRLPAPRPVPDAASTATAAIPGPTREQMEAARAIPPARQDEMVRGMVEGLAARLRANPRDADGWIRLMRSRMVLNQPEAAREALASALAAFADDAATQARLRGAARELGVS